MGSNGQSTGVQASEGKTISPVEIQPGPFTSQHQLYHYTIHSVVFAAVTMAVTSNFFIVVLWHQYPIKDAEEVVNTKDVLDWLSANPDVRDDLQSRHSRGHLMHYIKQCHLKILKRKEKKKGLPLTDKANTDIVSKGEERKMPVPLP